MEELLRLLVARAELSFDEICSATGRKRKSRSGHLDVQRQMKPFALTCGAATWFTARVVTTNK